MTQREARLFLAQITLITIAGIAAAYGATYWLGTPTPKLVHKYVLASLGILSVGGGLLLLGFVLWLALVERERTPIPRVRSVICKYLHPELVVSRVAPIVLTFAFIGAFSKLKMIIPFVHPFSWDRAFSDLDRVLFGIDPWRVTHALLGPSATQLIDAVYVMWLPTFWVVVFYFSVFASDEMRRRYFLSFFAIWTLLGLLAATIFSSAGPCFLEVIGSDIASRYHGLFPLQNAPGSLRIQAYLAEGYRLNQEGVGRGISAMPSIHVAINALYVLIARHYGRFAFTVAFLLYTLILVGSVHLGFHYLVDGVFATLGVAMIWRATRRSPPVATDISAAAVLLPATEARHQSQA